MSPLRSLDDIAAMLETTTRYRVLRRVPEPESAVLPDDRSDVRLGIVVDVEATGPDPDRDVPIEIAAIKFAYSATTSRILGICDLLLLQGAPPGPLSPDVVLLTGLTDADLAGQRIDPAEVADFFSDANLVCSHNAAYDRVIIERNFPLVPLRPWACSLNDIPWKEVARQTDRRLKDLLLMHGLFEAGHRAMADCRSLLSVLARPMPYRGDRTAFQMMLERARQMSVAIFAEGAPFDKRVVLRARGYRWFDGSDGAPRCWMHQVPQPSFEDEARFLRDEVYARGGAAQPTMTLLSAVNRYRPIEMIAAARAALPLVSRSCARALVGGDAS